MTKGGTEKRTVPANPSNGREENRVKEENGIVATLTEAQDKSISERKRQANRKNAQRSTGPKTPRGKSISRLNSLKHGLLARAVPLRTYLLSEEEKDLEKLLSDLWLELRPEGRVQKMLVERIACIYFQLSRLYRCQTALTTIALQNEHRNPTVELGDPGDQVRATLQVEETLAGLFGRATHAVASNQVFSPKLMADINGVILSSVLRFVLNSTSDEINKLVTASSDDKASKTAIGLARLKFLKLLEIGVPESLTMMRNALASGDELAKARFEQHLVPEEGALRRLQRYESMLDRQLYRALAKLEYVQSQRLGNALVQSTHPTMG